MIISKIYSTSYVPGTALSAFMYNNLFYLQETPIGKELVFPFYKILQMDRKRFSNVHKGTVSGRAQIQTQTNFALHQCPKVCALLPGWIENTP